MLNSMYYKETFLIAIILITTIIADDYHSNEEVTSTSLDFFDGENNNEFFDPRRQQSTLRNTFTGNGRSYINNRGSHHVMPEPELSGPSVAITTNSIPTTMMPSFDPVQTISSFTQQLDDEDISNYTTTSSAFNEVAPDHYIFTNISESESAEEQDDVIITTTPSSVTRMKQGKQIPISNLQPHEALRKFVEDSYIRRPLAILIDTSQDNLDEIKRLWMDALRPNAPLDCVLLAYNASGVPITYNFTNIRTLLAGINSIIGSENLRGNGFFGIIRAIDLIPFDSAVFVSTGMLPIDENLAQYAATSLLKKRIRLYLMWLGEKNMSENETHQEAGGILGSVAVRSGGEVIFAGDMRSGDYPTDNMVTVFTDHLQGTQDQEFTIEPTVSDLHIKVDTTLKSVTLETPNGEINLLKALRMKKFGSDGVVESKVNRVNGSDTQSDSKHQQMTSLDSKSNGKRRQFIRSSIHFTKPLSHPTKFHLKLQPESSKDKYRVTVLARNGYPTVDWSESVERDDLLSKRTFETFNLPDSKVDFKRENHLLNTRNLLQLTHESVRFPNESDNDMALVDDIIEVDKNIDGNATVSRQEQQVTNLQNLGTAIEMGVQSQLLLAPGTSGQLYFEITNYRSEPIFYTFQVTGEQQFLVSLNIPSLLFAPGQTAVAIVNVRIPPTASIGTKDQITFTCQGNGQVSKMAVLRVTQTTDNQDGSQPSLHWYYGSRCDGNKLETGVCADAIWSVDVTAHDWGTGLLRIQSNPRGIYTRSAYTSGTTSPVTAVYSSTCCQPKVTVTAYDLAGNARTATIDVRDIYLSEASIAAIVLGVILLTLLIIALIILIVWCCKRRRETIDLPTYRSHRRPSPT